MQSPEPQQSDLFTANFVRWGMFCVGVALIAGSLLLKWQPALLPRGTDGAIDISARVGLICLASWLAWPVLEVIRKAPGGILLVAGIMFTGIMFVVRKQTIYILGPYMLIAIIAAFFVGWLRKGKG
ncbi:hypothetical protein SH449x_000146 [Pirellulaceae bacterium SH449]